MELELQLIANNDPTVLKVFIAESYFYKKDLEKAYELFADLFKDPALSPIMKETVTNYLVIAGRELRKKEIEKITFKVTAEYDFEGSKSVSVITKETFSKDPKAVGDLVELLDFHLKEQHKQLQQQAQVQE